MAKKKSRKRTKRRRGTGSVIRVRKVNGLGQLNNPQSVTGAFMPAMLGGGATAVTTIGLRQLLPREQTWQLRAIEWAPWLGLIAGGLTAWGLRQTTGRAASWGAFAGASAVALGLVGSEMAAKAAVAGLGAIVPEYSNRRGMGAIVMEPHASRGYGAGALGGRRRQTLGSYGETVNLGNINPKAFGTPTFRA